MLSIGDFARHGRVSVRMLRQAELQSQIATDTARLAQVEARLQIIEREGTMPADDVKIKRIPGVRVAGLIGTAASFEPVSISPVIQPLYDELRDRLERAGLTPTGPAIAYYEDSPDGGEVLVHSTLPVDANGYRSAGYYRELYIGCRQDEDAWVTELQEPIATS
jgi:hypothetical protein